MRLFRSRFVWPFTLVSLLAGVFGAFGADESLETVFQRMDRASAKFKGLKAEMRKVSHEGNFNEDTVDVGTIWVKMDKPHRYKVLIDFRETDPKKVSLDETKLNIYLPKANTVQHMDLGKSNKGVVEQFLSLGFGSNSSDLQNAYSVKLLGSEMVGTQKTAHLELIPKSTEVRDKFPKFELWISDTTGIAIQQKYYEPGMKSFSTATYSNMDIRNISDSEVKLNLPKGVQHENLSGR